MKCLTFEHFFISSYLVTIYNILTWSPSATIKLMSELGQLSSSLKFLSLNNTNNISFFRELL